jgi:hypothetical protein
LALSWEIYTKVEFNAIGDSGLVNGEDTKGRVDSKNEEVA